jgi:hypothetical protein
VKFISEVIVDFEEQRFYKITSLHFTCSYDFQKIKIIRIGTLMFLQLFEVSNFQE